MYSGVGELYPVLNWPLVCTLVSLQSNFHTKPQAIIWKCKLLFCLKYSHYMQNKIPIPLHRQQRPLPTSVSPTCTFLCMSYSAPVTLVVFCSLETQAHSQLWAFALVLPVPSALYPDHREARPELLTQSSSAPANLHLFHNSLVALLHASVTFSNHFAHFVLSLEGELCNHNFHLLIPVSSAYARAPLGLHVSLGK